MISLPSRDLERLIFWTLTNIQERSLSCQHHRNTTTKRVKWAKMSIPWIEDLFLRTINIKHTKRHGQILKKGEYNHLIVICWSYSETFYLDDVIFVKLNRVLNGDVDLTVYEHCVMLVVYVYLMETRFWQRDHAKVLKSKKSNKELWGWNDIK